LPIILAGNPVHTDRQEIDMYAKLVKYTTDNGPVLADAGDIEVVPKEQLMIEGVRFWYRKYKGPSVAEIVGRPAFDDTRGHEILSYDTALDEPTRPDFELIRLVVYDSAGVEVSEIIAPNYQLYVMNEDGKTIDSVCCLVAQSATTR
jgi:hypothetical protein